MNVEGSATQKKSKNAKEKIEIGKKKKIVDDVVKHKKPEDFDEV